MAHDDYFVCKEDALGKVGFSSYKKCTATIRMLAYGILGDFIDEYVHMPCVIVQVLQGCGSSVWAEYPRQPNVADTSRLLVINADRGFPGCLVV